MNVAKIIKSPFAYWAIAVAMLLAFIVPAIVSAEQLVERSIGLSSSSKAATGVVYNVAFTADGGAGAFVVEFCSNTPVIGQSCTAPAGFSSAAAASTTVGFTDVEKTANKIVVTGTIAADAEIAVAVTGITNPTAAGPIYARIITYNNDTNADAYTSTNLGTGVVDQGSVAISITDTVGVSGAVLESLTFCVSGDEIEDECLNVEPPVLALGETTGDLVSLVPTEISDGSLYARISTNAVTGAVVRLKSSAVGCGGLMRAGAPTACDIEPALNTGITAGQAKFGVTATEIGGGTGTFQAVDGSNYNDTTYALNYVGNNATGVTSTYGDPFLDTDGAPASSKNIQMTFGASVSNSTPAGQYSADLSLIATGKF